MELRLIALTVAVFFCLVPPALGTGLSHKAAAVGAGLLAKKAIIGKGALIGAGLLAKKAVITKGAALGGALLAKKAVVVKGALAAKKDLVVSGALAAKSAAVGIVAHGAALLAAKKAAVKAKALSILAAKAAAVQGAVGLVAKGVAAGRALLNTKAIPYAVSQRIAYPSLVPMEVPVASPYIAEAYVPGPQAVMSRLAGLWGTIQNSVATKSVAVSDLVGAVGARAVVDAPPVYYEVPAPPRLYSVPVVGRVNDCI